jgi:hypothetical protein
MKNVVSFQVHQKILMNREFYYEACKKNSYSVYSWISIFRLIRIFLRHGYGYLAWLFHLCVDLNRILRNMTQKLLASLEHYWSAFFQGQTP